MDNKNLTVAVFVAVAIAAFCAQTANAGSAVAHIAGGVCASARASNRAKLQCSASAATFQSAFNQLSSEEQANATRYMNNARTDQDIANAITRAARVRRVSGSNVSALSNNVYNAVVGRS